MTIVALTTKKSASERPNPIRYKKGRESSSSLFVTPKAFTA